jgi:molybdate transport system substrate-binding protein
MAEAGDESGKVDRITGISSMAMRHVLAELGASYERHSGQTVDIISVGGVDAARRVANGEVFDLVVLAANAIEQLASNGRVDPGSRTDLARSGVAMAIAAGAPRPDVGSEAAIRDAVLRARTVGYSTGPSGAHLVRLFERWGIADVIAARIVHAAPGIPVGTLIARGDVELGFQQLSEFMHLPGVDVIGMLPPSIQLETVFSAGVCTAANLPAAAKAFLSFLTSENNDAALRRHGMVPARTVR